MYHSYHVSLERSITQSIQVLNLKKREVSPLNPVTNLIGRNFAKSRSWYNQYNQYNLLSCNYLFTTLSLYKNEYTALSYIYIYSVLCKNMRPSLFSHSPITSNPSFKYNATARSLHESTYKLNRHGFSRGTSLSSL